MKVLLLSRYGRQGASSRVRLFQYLSRLEGCGIQVTVDALLGDDYLDRVYRGQSRKIAPVVRAMSRRLSLLLHRSQFDLIWVEKEVFPWLPGLAEQAIRLAGCPYVVDYDDAIFDSYDRHRNAAVRWLLGGKIAGVIKRAAAVVAGNEYLAAYARSAGASRVVVLPSVVDTDRYASVTPVQREKVRLGWVGTPITQEFLAPMRVAIQRAAQQVPLELVLIGADACVVPGVEVRLRPWTEDTEVDEISRIDVGVMPLAPTPFAEGKCGYKLIQYMACGLPTIASPTGANKQIVEHGVTGFLASSVEDWTEAIVELATDHELRHAMGTAGRSRVERHYSLDIATPSLASLLTMAAR